MKVKGLTETQIAHLAVHGTLESFVEGTPAPVAAVPVAEAGALDAAASAAAAIGGGTSNAPAAEPPKAETPAPAPVATESEVVKFLKGELVAKDAALLKLTVDNQGLTDKLSAIDTTHSALLDIARGVVGNMRVAMGGTRGETASLTDIAVVAEHKTLSASFTEKFKVGGVAAVNAENDTKNKGVASPATLTKHQAAVKAAAGN